MQSGSSSGSGSSSSAGNNSNGTNYTAAVINATVFQALNATYVRQTVKEFRSDQINKWDFRLVTKQVEEIFNTMKLKDETSKTMHGDRVYMKMFIDDFSKCDIDKDNQLNLDEFQQCMSADTYLKLITPPDAIYASWSNFTVQDKFNSEIYNTLNIYNTTLNFAAYMELRLMLFSWRKCGVGAPFLEEIVFECVVNIVSKGKTASRTTLRNIFYQTLELSGSTRIRNLDFISFMYLAQSLRAFGSISGKLDNEISRDELNLALDGNILYDRFNQDIINAFFQLVEDYSSPTKGLDLRTFTYLDFNFRIYGKYSVDKKWKLNFKEFTNVLLDPTFPALLNNTLSLIPTTFLTANSYQMFTYMNITKFHDEGDFFVKFAEKNSVKSKVNLRTSAKMKEAQAVIGGQIMSSANTTINNTEVMSRVFILMDTNNDGYLEFYEYGLLIQITHIFARIDTLKKGYILAGDAFEKYSEWSEYPKISTKLRSFANRMNLINQDSYIHLFNIMVLLRVDDNAALYTRRSDPSTLYELELKKLFLKLNLGNANDDHYRKCIRGVDSRKIPIFDWDCAFSIALQDNINVEESALSYNTVKANGISLTSTVFYNKDPALS